MAAAYLPFAQLKAERAALPELVAAVGDAFRADDRARLYCYVEVLPERVKPAGTMGDGGYASDPHATDKNDLRDLLAQARDRLADPRYAEINKAALATAARASSLVRDAQQRRREAERATVRYAFQPAGDVSWSTGEPVTAGR